MVNPCPSVSICVPKKIRDIRAIRVQNNHHPHGKSVPIREYLCAKKYS